MQIYPGPEPITATCPNCLAHIRSSITSEPSLKAYLCCGILCLIGFCLCAWIPFVMKRFHDTVHRCPNCGAFLGRYSV